MGLKVTHDKIEDVPEAHRELYTEREGKFHLTGIEGLKTQSDVDVVQGNLVKERDDHKATKLKYHPWAEMKYDEVTAKMDRFAELEVAAKGNKDEMDAKLEELTEARVVSRLAPVDRENKTLKTRLDELEKENTTLKQERTTGVILKDVRASAIKDKVDALSLPDVELLATVVFGVDEATQTVLTKDNPFGIPAGLSSEVFFTEMKGKRNWWPTAVGGDSTGSHTGINGGNNPWSREHWNMTEQGKIVVELGEDKATQMAKLAGTTLVGGPPKEKAKA